MKLIKIIPAYNEALDIKNVSEEALKYSDVLVVDDGSNDETNPIARESGAMVVKHEKNLGKGAAIKTGLKFGLEKGYDVFVILDGDGQHDPSYIPALTAEINGAGVVIGSRFLGGIPDNMPLQRKVSNAITTNLIKYVTGYTLTDSQCGFRAISKGAAEIFVDIGYDDYVYESEMIHRAAKNDMVIREAPVSCRYGHEKSYITWINVLHYIFFILKLVLRKIKSRVTF